MTKRSILHIATDYPDATELNATHATKNLFEASQSLNHTVIALRREKKAIWSVSPGSDHILFRAMTFPFGMCHILLSFFYALTIYRHIKRNDIHFDIIHGHKLTIDGVVAFFLAKFSNKPYLLSVRGDTDLKFISKMPLSRAFYKYIYQCASHIFWVSLWARKALSTQYAFPYRIGSKLPNIVKTNIGKPGQQPLNSPKFAFIGRLESAHKKGLYDALTALANIENASLDIFGMGNGKAVDQLTEHCQKLAITERVNFKGRIEKAQLMAVLPNYCALVMPSFHETFGMVYVEALLSGLPVIACKNSGIDGFIDNKPYLTLVDYGDTTAITQGMQAALVNQSKNKCQLINDLHNNRLAVFQTPFIVQQYCEAVINV